MSKEKKFTTFISSYNLMTNLGPYLASKYFTFKAETA